MRTVLPFVAIAVLLIQACATSEVETSAEPVVQQEQATYVPQQGLSDEERFREILYLLEEGGPVPARAELVVYLQSNADREIGQDLLRQIDESPTDYFAPDYFEVEPRSGDSLSTLSEYYLGSVYKFHALAKYNGIPEPGSLTAVQMIRIPMTMEAQAALSGDPVAAANSSADENARADVPTGVAEEKQWQATPAQANADEQNVSPSESVPDIDAPHKEALNAC